MKHIFCFSILSLSVLTLSACESTQRDLTNLINNTSKSAGKNAGSF